MHYRKSLNVTAWMILLPGMALSFLTNKPGLGVGPDGRTALRKTWDFESDEPGRIARGFSAAMGTWEVTGEAGNHVLFQKARNEDDIFNVALALGTSFQDVDLGVRLKAVAGEVDQGGGLVWRAKDKNNYYLCRYNPLEDNFRVYKVVKGKRTQLRSAKAPGVEGWHTLRATMTGPKIVCYLDGRKLLEAEDSTFRDAGMVGLWSKSDARSYFDDLTVE